MLIGLKQRDLRPDLILFADIGNEKPETYLYAPFIQQWLRDAGFANAARNDLGDLNRPGKGRRRAGRFKSPVPLRLTK